MTESGLHPIQTWLWSELDDLGIDGVIYSRHILDLLITSKHTFDHRLDEKEQSIFSKIAPGSKKRKHKCYRRSNSVSVCEEIIWRKEIAVACLLSAAETKDNPDDTAATIQHVVDELYSKLEGLNLTSDGKRASSDGDYPLNDRNGNVATRKKSGKKENYEDAFPSLEGTRGSTASTNLVWTVWNKAEKIDKPKSGRDSDNSYCSRPLKSNSGKESSRFRNSTSIKGWISPYLGSRSEGEATTTTDVVSRRLYPRSANRRFMDSRKQRKASTDCANLQTATSAQQPKKSPRSRYTHSTRFQPRYRKGECQKKKKTPEKFSPQKRKLATSKNTFNQKYQNSKREISSSVAKVTSPQTTRNDGDDVEHDYAHLPSWMKTTLADVATPQIWNIFETVEVQGDGQEEDKEPPFSNRWYREPDSGLLTYQPLKSEEERARSSSSCTALSRPSSSLCEEESEELLKDVESDSDTPPAPESWMWCPSPSLWEDRQISPVSRLQSVYKRELMSLGTESHVDDISGRIWEEYKTIFLDLQSMHAKADEGTSSEEDQSPFEQPNSSIWGPSELPYPARHHGGFPLANSNLIPLPNSGSEALMPEFDMWSRPIFMDIEKAFQRNQSYDSLASSSSVGESAIHNDVPSNTNIWNYSPVQAWSADDGLNHSNNSNRVQPDEELALLMQNGAFGYICPSRMSGWGLVTQDGASDIAQSTPWGGCGTSSIEKPETPMETSEEMMHNIVDALFSDLLFCSDDDEPHPNRDHDQIPSRTPVTPSRTPVTPSFHNSFRPEFPTSVSFDFRSLFVQSPFQNFHSPNNNPWQPQWHLDDLVLRAGLTRLSPLIQLDDLFMSLAATEDPDRRFGRLSETPQTKKSFYDSVTENDAWQTSVRIGNIWQNISGIRPVNVLYSENKPGPSREEKLIPSSATHFRPISSPIGTDTPDYGSTMTPDTSLTSYEPEFHGTGQDLSDQVNLLDISSDEIGHIFHPEPTEELNFQTKKHVQDKSMQTSFDASVQQDISSCRAFLPRPPQATSR